MSVFSYTKTRLSCRSVSWSWFVPTSTAMTLAAPFFNRQSVKPPVLEPMSRQSSPRTLILKTSRAFLSLRAPLETYSSETPFSISMLSAGLFIGAFGYRLSVPYPPPLGGGCFDLSSALYYFGIKSLSSDIPPLYGSKPSPRFLKGLGYNLAHAVGVQLVSLKKALYGGVGHKAVVYGGEGVLAFIALLLENQSKPFAH